jgi:hypothetical protein
MGAKKKNCTVYDKEWRGYYASLYTARTHGLRGIRAHLHPDSPPPGRSKPKISLGHEELFREPASNNIICHWGILSSFALFVLFFTSTYPCHIRTSSSLFPSHSCFLHPSPILPPSYTFSRSSHPWYHLHSRSVPSLCCPASRSPPSCQ